MLLGLIDGVFNLDQQYFHPLRPDLTELFGQKSQFSQMMGVAKNMPASIILVGSPAIMDSPAGEDRQDADGIHREASALGMGFIVS